MNQVKTTYASMLSFLKIAVIAGTEFVRSANCHS